jgi:hypothetical protein
MHDAWEGLILSFRCGFGIGFEGVRVGVKKFAF